MNQNQGIGPGRLLSEELFGSPRKIGDDSCRMPMA